MPLLFFILKFERKDISLQPMQLMRIQGLNKYSDLQCLVCIERQLQLSHLSNSLGKSSSHSSFTFSISSFPCQTNYLISGSSSRSSLSKYEISKSLLLGHFSLLKKKNVILFISNVSKASCFNFIDHRYVRYEQNNIFLFFLLNY